MTPETQTSVKTRPTHRLSSQQRRAVILDSAARLFAERGYHAASISEIARMAGITKPVIYHHFSSKQESSIAPSSSTTPASCCPSPRHTGGTAAHGSASMIS